MSTAPKSRYRAVEDPASPPIGWTHRPVLLDLFCCSGGAALGYQRAGFEVWGVDMEEQPRYVGERFQRGDAITVGRGMLIAYEGTIRAVHASPPCQAHTDLQKQNKRHYEDFIEPTRELLVASGLPFIIENVEGAPLRPDAVLCGTMFPDLRVIRHRVFESNIPLSTPAHGPHPLVFTHDKRKAHYGKLDQDTSFVQVTGGGNCTIRNAREAMGMPWATKHELNEAIPPRYTEHLGRQLMRAVEARQEAAA